MIFFKPLSTFAVVRISKKEKCLTMNLSGLSFPKKINVHLPGTQISRIDFHHQFLFSIEYWFRCLDLDGDGILSMFELDYFYQEQVHKMEIYGIEYMPFEDCICQMLDLVKPEEENKIRLKDLKRCKLTNVFFDTFFNLEKYLENEQKDPFSNLKVRIFIFISNRFFLMIFFSQDPDSPEVSDWIKYAENEYDNLTHEDGGNDNLDDV